MNTPTIIDWALVVAVGVIPLITTIKIMRSFKPAEKESKDEKRKRAT